MLQKDIELYYRSLWPTTVEFSILEPFFMMICHITKAMEKTSYNCNWYKLSDDNVIGGNSKRCLKTRGELNNLSQSNLKDWMGKGRNWF